MATSIITPDQDAIITEIEIAAPIDRVFKAISDADDIRRRSPHLAVYEMEARVGGKWRLEMHVPKPFHGVTTIHHAGEILEFDPPRLLVYSWTANFHKDPHGLSTVRWELTPTKSGTHVKVTHSGLASEPTACKDYAGGWPGVLADIKKQQEASPKG
ncbi:MAG: SRPBCC family protein [Candidatus Sulfotelmatobacter sp.]